MEALGIDIQMPMDRLRHAIQDLGFGFLFAPRFHSSMKHVVPVRMQLKVRTVFNILGPLANPAGARFQVAGVSSLEVMELMINAFHGLDVEYAFVVHSYDGLDEISISGPTQVMELSRGEIRQFVIQPQDLGIPLAPAKAILGGDPASNAKIIEAILRGEPGPPRDVVVLNAAAAILAGGGASTWKGAVHAAQESIDTGMALKKLNQLREFA